MIGYLREVAVEVAQALAVVFVLALLAGQL